MPKYVIVLEDDAGRTERMRAWADRFPGVVPRFWTNSGELCRDLLKLWPDVVLVSLDHDLGLEPDGDGRLVDQGSGMEVAELLAGRRPEFPVAFHSTNSRAVDQMDALLTGRGWQTARVTPFDDLAWIDREWWPTVRRLLTQPAAAAARPKPPGHLPFRVEELLREVIAAGRQGGDPDLSTADARLLRRWVRYVVPRVSRLVAYANWLRGELKLFPRLRNPSAAVADVLLDGGPNALPLADLVPLALDPVALFHLHDRVREERPVAWRDGGPVVLPFEPLRMHVGPPHQKAAVAAPLEPDPRRPAATGPAAGYTPAKSPQVEPDVYFRSVDLPYEGQTYQGTLTWDADRQSGQRYVRLRFNAPRRSPLAGVIANPKLIVRYARFEGANPRPEWRAEVPLTWHAKRGKLVSSWYPVPFTKDDPIELELSLSSIGPAKAAAARCDDDATSSPLAGRPCPAANGGRLPEARPTGHGSRRRPVAGPAAV